MKKIFLLVFLFAFLGLSAFADYSVISSKSVKHYGLGVLNMKEDFCVYESPDKNSEIIYRADGSAKKRTAILKSTREQKVSYLAYFPSSNAVFLPVDTDEGNGWYKVYLDQKTGRTGWVFDEDEDAFFTYKRLFYTYGKKYGIKMFADLPENKKVLFSKPEDDSKQLEQLSYPKYVNFNVIAGNWMLVSVVDMSKHAKIGWFNWRNDDGTLNAFPNFKEQL